MIKWRGDGTGSHFHCFWNLYDRDPGILHHILVDHELPVRLERYQARHPIPNNIGCLIIPIPVRDETLNWMQVKNCTSQHTIRARVTCCHEFNLKLTLNYFNLNIKIKPYLIYLKKITVKYQYYINDFSTNVHVYTVQCTALAYPYYGY